MSIQYLPLDWNSYHDYCLKLAATLLTHHPEIDEIVAISRGGLTFGHILSDLLRVPIWTITIQSYTDIQTQGEIQITGKLQNSIENKHILLVDDVADSGKTLVRAVDYLREAKAEEITTMTMFYKPRSIFRPDYFAKQTTKWILFPYEPTEMIMLITQMMIEEHKSKAEIQTQLESLNYTDKQISFTRKYHISKRR